MVKQDKSIVLLVYAVVKSRKSDKEYFFCGKVSLICLVNKTVTKQNFDFTCQNKTKIELISTILVWSKITQITSKTFEKKQKNKQ